MLTRLAGVYGAGISCAKLLGALVFSRYRLYQQRYLEIREPLGSARTVEAGPQT
jgi:hypothetical protein